MYAHILLQNIKYMQRKGTIRAGGDHPRTISGLPVDAKHMLTNLNFLAAARMDPHVRVSVCRPSL